MSFLRSILVWLVIGSVASMSSAQALSGDFDGDGIADIPLIQINNLSLQWNLYSPGQGSSGVQAQSFGAVGNHIVYAPWSQTARAEFATVQSTSSGVSWSIRSAGGQATSKSFGKTSDQIVSGADVNGNGTADAIVVRSRGNGLRWFIQSDFFTPQAKAVGPRTGIIFGAKNDTVVFLSPDGVRDHIGVFSTDGAGNVTLRHRAANRRGVTSVSFGVQSLARRPLPIGQPAGGDLVMFSSQSSGVTSLSFFNLSGALLLATSVNVSGEVIVGDYALDLPGEEVAIQGGAGFVVINPLANVVRDLITPGGIAIDTININSFKKSGDECTPTEETLNPRDGNEGFLWKPISDSTRKLAILAPARYTGQVRNITLYSPDGATVLEVGRDGGVGNGTRVHARFNKPGGRYPVGTIVRINLTCGAVRYVITTPSQRVD